MRSTVRRAGLLSAGVIVLALIGSGCGGDSTGPGVASTGAPAARSSSSGGPDRAGLLAYSKCMRAHGVPNFPDPTAHGGLQVDGNKVHANSPQYKVADQACKPLLPPPPPGQDSAKNKAAALKYAKCMRAHGVPKFPDPNAEGAIDVDADKLGVDPNGPVFKAADKACQHFMGTNRGRSESGTSGSGGAGS